MIKLLPKDLIPQTRPEEPTAAPNAVKSEVEIDPAEVLADLKMREVLLNRLIKKGGNIAQIEDINRLKEKVVETITELEKIIEDPATDSLSTKEPI